MNVNFNYLDKEFKDSKILFSKWYELIKSNEYTLGKYVEKFEKELSLFTNNKYCIGVNSGTDALILSMRALRISRGDEVLVPVNTFYATVGAIISVGAKPIFVDVNDIYLINENLIEKKITKKTKAIVTVDWTGNFPNYKKIIELANKFNLKIIEDACMSLGGNYYNSSLGNLVDAAVVSFHPLKVLNVIGDGGAFFTNNYNVYKWAKLYRNHGMTNREKINIWGVNMRIQPFQAIVGSHKLKFVNKTIVQRNKNVKYLTKKLEGIQEITLPKENINILHTYTLFMIKLKSQKIRNKLYQYLIAKNIDVKIHYPLPLHLQKASKSLGYKKGDFPIAENQAKTIITLPIHQYLKQQQLDYMVEKINYFFS